MEPALEGAKAGSTLCMRAVCWWYVSYILVQWKNELFLLYYQVQNFKLDILHLSERILKSS